MTNNIKWTYRKLLFRRLVKSVAVKALEMSKSMLSRLQWIGDQVVENRVGVHDRGIDVRCSRRDNVVGRINPIFDVCNLTGIKNEARVGKYTAVGESQFDEKHRHHGGP